MNEWDRYVEDQKYARSLRWNAEAGFVRGLIICAACAIISIACLVYVAIVFGRAVACWAWFQAC